MPTPGSETYKSSNPLETRDKSTYSSRKLPELIPGPDVPDIPEMEVAPTVTAIEPDTLPVSGPDTEVTVTGDEIQRRFSVIIWNGGAEPTTLIDAGASFDIVKPSTVEVELPFTLPVAVRNGHAAFGPAEFTFVAEEDP